MKTLATNDECPLCSSTGCCVVDQVESAEIVAGYRSSFGCLDVSDQFPADVKLVKLKHCPSCDLIWYDPLASGSSVFYEKLQLNDWYYQNEKAEFGYVERILKAMDRRPSVLEVGCGGGAFGMRVREYVDYRGLEFNGMAIEKARGVGLVVERQSVQQEAAVAAGRYDVVCHFQVLEHVSDPRGFMQACVKLLKPGGLLAVSVPAEDSLVGHTRGMWLNMPPHHVTRWSDQALRMLFSRLGLIDTSIWHEPPAKFHAEWYRATLRQYALSFLGVASKRLVPPNRFVRRAVRVPIFASLLEEIGRRTFPFPGRGMTVTACGFRSG